MSGTSSWEVVRGDPGPRLAGDALRLVGFTETPAGVLVRRELPSAVVPLIASWGAPYRVASPERPGEVVAPREGFVAGPGESWADTETTGPAACVQLNLTPTGAFRLLGGRPVCELADRAAGLGDLFGAEGTRLAERLGEAAGWEARFALVRDFAAARIAAAPPAAPGVLHALERLHAAGGGVDVAALAREVGWSRKHLAARFREQVGLAPKALARVLRFRRALRMLGEPAASLSAVALRCGYCDQAHMNRDFRAFAGTSPGAWLRGRAAAGPDAPAE
ncbi:MAG TPA: AraC family transcriptional regulator [Longimicrobiaceae bacterium]